MGKKNRQSRKSRGHPSAMRALRDAHGKFQGSVPLPVSPPQGLHTVPSQDLSEITVPHGESSLIPSYDDAYGVYRERVREPAETDASARTAIFSTVAADLEVPVESVEQAFTSWATADPMDFEDYPSPNSAFRYDIGITAPEAERRALRKLGYEHFLRQKHPVFTYGTLREGQGNSALMDHARERTVTARMSGVALYTKHWGFPYAHEVDDDSQIVGEIVWLSDSPSGVDARRALDYLEGFDSDFPSSSHYERCERELEYFDTATGTMEKTRVWVYFARGSAAKSLRPEDRLESGDWVRESTMRHSTRTR